MKYDLKECFVAQEAAVRFIYKVIIRSYNFA